MTKTGGKKTKKTATRKANKHRARDLKALGAGLEAKREDILAMYEHDLRAGQETGDQNTDDIVDRANNSYNRELLFALSDGERQTLLEVEGALKRLEAGDYGECMNCSEVIGLQRLQAVPWARYCIDCQELSEKGMLQEA